MITIRDFSFGYSPRHLLYNCLSLDLTPGKIYGLLGKNGAGKSTLLKNIMGLLFPVGGSIKVNQHTPGKRKPGFLENMYFIPEEVYVPALSAGRYCALHAPFYPLFDKEAFLIYANQLEVDTERKLNTLSFGQQKKFIIAFALACNTPFLLLDEPTNGLDIPSKIQFRKLLASVMSPERTIVISTHQIRDLNNLIDEVLIVDSGKLLVSASLWDIAQKLSFSSLANLSGHSNVLYAEPSLRGYSVITENTANTDSQVDLEEFFNGVLKNASVFQKLLTKTNTLS